MPRRDNGSGLTVATWTMSIGRIKNPTTFEMKIVLISNGRRWLGMTLNVITNTNISVNFKRFFFFIYVIVCYYQAIKLGSRKANITQYLFKFKFI